MPKVSKSRARRRTTRGRSTSSARRKTTAVVNPRPKRRRRPSVAAPRRPARRRSYRRNPAELMELGALLANPLSKSQQEIARAMRSRAGGKQSIGSIASVLRAKPGMVQYYLGGKKKKAKKSKSTGKKGKSKAKKHKKGKAHRASRVLRFHVPRGRKVGKVRVEFNPRLNWMEMKESAKVALFATLGFAGASMATNLISGKLFSGGSGAAVGPLKSPTVVSLLLAVAVPFLPIQAPWKKDLVTGVLVHAAARLMRDILPAGSAVQQHLPGTMGEFALATYIPEGTTGVPQTYFDTYTGEQVGSLQAPLNSFVPAGDDYPGDMRGVDEFGEISAYEQEF
jgi:hypothetical protein